MSRSFWLASIAPLVLVVAAGCPSSGPQPANVGEPPASGAHDHDHHHHHEGPHGGHIIEIGKEEYHAEWTHDETGKVTVYLLDKDMKKEVPVPAEKVVIDVKIGENVKSYDLPAVNRTSGESPTAFQFETTDKSLLGGLEALSKGGVEATLKVAIDGKDFAAPIEHDHHDHKH